MPRVEKALASRIDICATQSAFSVLYPAWAQLSAPFFPQFHEEYIMTPKYQLITSNMDSCEEGSRNTVS